MWRNVVQGTYEAKMMDVMDLNEEESKLLKLANRENEWTIRVPASYKRRVKTLQGLSERGLACCYVVQNNPRAFIYKLTRFGQEFMENQRTTDSMFKVTTGNDDGYSEVLGFYSDETLALTKAKDETLLPYCWVAVRKYNLVNGEFKPEKQDLYERDTFPK